MFLQSPMRGAGQATLSTPFWEFPLLCTCCMGVRTGAPFYSLLGVSVMHLGAVQVYGWLDDYLSTPFWEFLLQLDYIQFF